MRLTCQARSSAETTTVTARLTLMDATASDPERVDLAFLDRLFVRSGKFGATLARHYDMFDAHDGEYRRTYAYEAAIPTGPKLEMGFTRWEHDATTWGEILLPAPPELTLEGQRLSWTKSESPGGLEAIEIFVACDDGEAPKVDPQQRSNAHGDYPDFRPGLAARYKPPKDDGGIDVDALLSLAKTAPAYNTPGDWAKCSKLSVVVSRTGTVAVPELAFGAAQCSVESSRGLALPPRAVPSATANTPDAPPNLEIGR